MHLESVDATQLKHFDGPVVCAAQALKLAVDGNTAVGEQVVCSDSGGTWHRSSSWRVPERHLRHVPTGEDALALWRAFILP